MRVVRIITRLNVGGPVQQVEVLDGLDGVENIVLAGRCENGEVERIRPDYRIEHLRREVGLVNDWRAYREIKRVLRETRPDLVHTHTSKAGFLGRLAAWRLGIPSVHTYHGFCFHSYFGRCKTAVVKMVERLLARVTHTIIAISPTQRDELVGVIGSGDKIRVVWNGLELWRFKHGWQPKREARRALGLPEDKLIFGWVGRLVPVKNVGEFVEHINHKCGPGVVGVVLGDGPERDKIYGRVLHIPHLKSNLIPVFYSAIDQLHVTSLNEGVPTCIVEAMAAGVTWVASRKVGGIPDLDDLMDFDVDIFEFFSPDRLRKDILKIYKEVV